MSNNVFADIGLINPELHPAKAEIVRQIAGLIEKQGLTQSQVGEMFGLSQGKVSTLLRGQFTGYSVDRLIRFLTILKADVTIVINPDGSGETQVIKRAA